MERIDLALARIERIKTFFEAWQREGSISGIERNIVLSQLALLYDELHGADTKAVPQKATSSKVGSKKKQDAPVVKQPEPITEDQEDTTDEPETIEAAEQNIPVTEEPAAVTAAEIPVEQVAEEQTEKPKEKKEKGRLGEQLNSSRKSLFESFGERDEAAARMSPVSDLGSAVGINDRFLFIKELFNGDAKQYEQTIAKLNSCANIEEAFMHIHQNFAWDEGSQAAKHFVTLVRRRFM